MTQKLGLLFISLLISSISFAGDFTAPAKARELVKKEKALLLDVRTLMEFKMKHIDGAKRIPISDLQSRLDDVKKMVKGDKNHPIVVYCQSGGRASAAKEILEKAGYKRVYNLGGWARWYEK